MADRLVDSSETELSVAVMDLFPSLDTVVIKNRLLSGLMFVQTVGEPTKMVTFKVVANDENMNMINEMEATGETVKVYYDDKYYVGLIYDLGKWQEQLFGEVDNRLYVTEMTVAVDSEGTV
jgi:hypothetical protein